MFYQLTSSINVREQLTTYQKINKVDVRNKDQHFFYYSITLLHKDGRPVESKGTGRKVLDRVQNSSKLAQFVRKHLNWS